MRPGRAGTGRVLVAALVACLVAPTAPRAAAAARSAGWIVSRTDSGPADFHAAVHVEATGAEASLAVFALTGRGARRLAAPGFTTLSYTWGADGWPRPYAPGVTYPDCPAAPSCAPVSGPFAISRLTLSSRVLSGTVYVAAWDAAVAIDVDSPGWRIRPWRPAMNVVTTDEGGGAGARVAHGSFGTFRAAEAPGGRYGSYAHASIPCGSRGEGTATFTGGRRSYTFECGGMESFRADTPRATRWRVTGDVTSVDSGDVVMVVVDYPPG